MGSSNGPNEFRLNDLARSTSEGSSGIRQWPEDFRGAISLLAFFPNEWDPSREQVLASYRRVFAKLGVQGQVLDRCRTSLEEQRALGLGSEQALVLVDRSRAVRYLFDGDLGGPDFSSLVAAIESLDHPGITRRTVLISSLAASLALGMPALARAKVVPGERQVRGSRKVTLNVNGRNMDLELEPRVTLLDALRDRLGMTGTKKGCDHGQCGACTVHLDDRRVNSCLMLAMQAEGRRIMTVEGLAKRGDLHPVQAAFVEHDGFQCGYCTSGQIMSAVACIHEGHTTSDDEIREWMSGNICRCGAYNGICDAIKSARSRMRGAV